MLTTLKIWLEGLDGRKSKPKPEIQAIKISAASLQEDLVLQASHLQTKETRGSMKIYHITTLC